MTITCSQISNGKRLDDILSVRGKDVIVAFLKDAARKMPNPQWLADSMSSMSQTNQKFAQQNGATDFEAAMENVERFEQFERDGQFESVMQCD